jgi:hypothetical protein
MDTTAPPTDAPPSFRTDPLNPFETTPNPLTLKVLQYAVTLAEKHGKHLLNEFYYHALFDGALSDDTNPNQQTYLETIPLIRDLNNQLNSKLGGKKAHEDLFNVFSAVVKGSTTKEAFEGLAKEVEKEEEKKEESLTERFRKQSPPPIPEEPIPTYKRISPTVPEIFQETDFQNGDHRGFFYCSDCHGWHKEEDKEWDGIL